MLEEQNCLFLSFQDQSQGFSRSQPLTQCPVVTGIPCFGGKTPMTGTHPENRPGALES